MADKTPEKRKGNMSGNSPNPKKPARHSPYKAMARRNSNYCGYVSMSVLEPNKAYKIYKVDHTEHDIYGPGELAFIENNRKIKQRVQLPSKYLKELSDEELAILKSDVEQGKFPYLIFRATLPDKSFRIDVLPNGPEMLEFHTTWKDVPDVSELDFLNLESSIETDDGNKEEGSPKTGHDDDLCN